MNKLSAFLGLAIILCSCSSLFESIGDAIHKDKGCWIDTREMNLYFYGKEKMTGITINKYGSDKSIEIVAKDWEKGFKIVELMPYKDSLVNRSVEIWVERENVHWRDHIIFQIEPKDWSKKKIVSRHYYH